ncbi:MAG: endo-1,4-beta-xylanase [Lachnospiraceae bacterium]|nr:endo-1,4-beta-xylanase [Lachnospiraceae bacterium]
MKLRKVMAGTLALALVTASLGVTAPDSAAAAKKPKLAKKSVAVTVKKTQKVKIKNTKKIKKTKWSVKSKKIATLSKKKKTYVVIKGKKAGNTKVTAKVTLKGKKKPLKLTLKVTVEKAATPTPKATVKPTPKKTNTPKNTPTPDPTVAPVPDDEIKTVTVDPIEKSNPTATSVPDGVLDGVGNLTATFDSYTTGASIGFGSYDEANNKDIVIKENLSDDQNTIDGFSYRRTGVDNSKKLKVSVVDAGRNGKCLEVSGRLSTAQGALLDLTEIAVPGATYEFKAYVKTGANVMNGATLVCSTETKATAAGKETYANIATFNKNLTDWQEVTATVYIPDDMAHFGFYIETWNDSTTNIYIDDVTFTQIQKPNPVENLRSLKDLYTGYFDYFGLGVGYDSFMGESGMNFIKKQFNSVTFGNEMKPESIMTAQKKADGSEGPTTISLAEAKELGYYIPEGYETDEANMKKGEVVVPYLDFTNVDAMLKQAQDNGIKIRGHVLTWHQQTPVYFFQQEYKTTATTKYNVSQETMDKRLEFYIRSVMNHVLESDYADVIYSWDVTNEYLHTKNGNDGNYWHTIYGTEDKTYSTQSNMVLNPLHVKKAFQIAHDVLVQKKRTDITLMYNDYNTYDVSNDIIKMLRWINTKDSINTYGQICDGIGMQAHLDITDNGANPTVDRFAETMEKFRVNLPGLEIAITELDVTLGFNGTADTLTDLDQASYYEDIMRSILACKKRGAKIDSVTLWSIYDGLSWRDKQRPCVFKGLNQPKAAFYALIDAVETYFPEPFITK